MASSGIFNYYRLLQQDNLSFIYSGEFNDDITDGIIRLTEYNAGNITELAGLKKRFSFLIVECFQNLIRHSKRNVEKTEASHKGLFLTRNIGHNNFISSANLVEQSKIDKLKALLNNINNLGPEELKAKYLESLANDELSEKGGANLGLIELARKSGRPLDFDFENKDELFSNFYLTINLKKKGMEDMHKNNAALPINFAKTLHTNMQEEEIVLIYKGDFARHSIIPITKIIEEHVQDKNTGVRDSKRVYLALVELLQNIAKHSMNVKNRDGIFYIGRKNGNYVISVGNLVQNSTAEILTDKLEKLNNLDKEGLKSLYLKTLREGKFSERGGGGLGLIDVAREALDKIEFNFEPVENNVSFYSIKINV